MSLVNDFTENNKDIDSKADFTENNEDIDSKADFTENNEDIDSKADFTENNEDIDFKVDFTENNEDIDFKATNVSYSENDKVKTVSKSGKSNDEEDPDDPCVKKRNSSKNKKKIRTVGEDPRFQQQNQTLRCYVSYTDYFRCQKILGENHEACDWFKDVYNTFCPLKWIEDWDEARAEGRMPWHKRNQGKFPGDKYG